MIEFLHLSRPAGLLLPLLVAAALALWVRRRRRVARALGDAGILARLVPEDLVAVPRGRVSLVMLAALALGAALFDPGRSATDGRAAAGGGPVVLVLDVSNSMLAEDVRPSRLALLRETAGRLVERLDDTPVGIVVFAGRAFALSPPTVDPSALELYLDALDPEMVTQTGSSLSAAVRQAVNLLASTRERSGTVVLLSDGDAFEAPDEIREAVRLARRAGVPVYTEGIGTPAGAPVPDVDFRTGRRVGFKREPTGETAISRLNEELLQQIAQGTGARHVAVTGPARAELLTSLVHAGVSGAGEGSGGGDTRYAWFAVAALVLLVVEGSLARRAGGGRRRTHTAMAVAAILLGGCTGAPPPERARRGYDEAARQYATMLEHEPGSALLRYNLGTSLLLAGRHAESRPHLEAAARAEEVDVRWRAFYNLGNSHLEPAFQQPRLPGRDAELRSAIEAYKWTLLLVPHEMDAKWNLELARRLLRPDPQGGGGGGGEDGGGGESQQQQDPDAAESGGDSPEMSPEAADRILASARQRELSVQQQKLRKPQPPNPSAH